MAPSSLHQDSGHDNNRAAGGRGSAGGGVGGGEVDVRDVATDSQKLALAMSSDTPDARYTVRRLLSDHAPMVKPLHLTLLGITAKLNLVKTRKEELVALTKMCTFLAAAYVIVMSHQREQQQEQQHEEERKQLNGGGMTTSSAKSSADGRSSRSSRSSSGNSSSVSSSTTRKMMRSLDLGPLEECVETLAALVERKGKRRKALMRISESSGKNEIVDLNARVSDLARDMGLAGIVAVFKGVLDDTGAGGYGSQSDGDVLTPQEVDLARQPKPTADRAHVPCLVPPREGWHVRRDRVINAVLETLLSNRGRCSDGNSAVDVEGRGEGTSCTPRPRVVGLVGESGSGKTSVAAEIVRSPEVLEYFSDGVVWLPVNSGDGEEDRLQALMHWLARLVREEIGARHDCGDAGGGRGGGGGGFAASTGGGASGSFSNAGTNPSAGLARNSEDGAARVRSFVRGGEIHGGVRRRRELRCLVVADNVCDAEVVAKLKETGMWVLLTSRRPDVVRRAGGKSVVVGRLLEADAEWVLRRASELPSDEPSPVGSSDLLDLCGRTALDLAFVGRWRTVRGSKDPMAWRDAADSIRADLQNLELTREGETGIGKYRALLSRQQSTASCSTVDDGAAPVSVLGSDASSPRPSSCSSSRILQARENRRKAILRAGFRELVTATGDDRVRLLYLSLGVLPDGHDFTAKDAVVLLRESHHDQGSSGGEATAAGGGGGEWVQKGGAEEKAARKALRTLEAWSILAATGRRRGSKSASYRMHTAHSTFAREILLECHEVLKSAVRRWIGFISSLDAVLFFDPLVLSRLWSAVEDVGGKGWRDLRPYEAALSSIDNHDPLCRVCLVAVAKFRGAEGDFGGASAMWRRLLTVEQRAQTPNVLYPLWELVTAAEKSGKPEEAAEWRQYGYETLNLAMVKSTMMSPLETEVEGDGDGFRTTGSGGGGGGGSPVATTDTASVIQSLSLNVVRFGPSQGAEAEMMLRRALEIEVARRGPDDLRVAAVLERLGICVRQSGRLKEAEQLLRRALKIAETKHGEEDVLVARTVFHLGVCLRLAGSLEDAEELLWRSLDVETAKHGPDNVNIAGTLHELGLCVRLSSETPTLLKARGGGRGSRSRHRLEESTALFAHALEIREARLGPDDPAVGNTLHELGVCLRQDGRHSEAEAFLRRALGIRRAITRRLGKGTKENVGACSAAAVAAAASASDTGAAAAAAITKYGSNNSSSTDRGSSGSGRNSYGSSSSNSNSNNAEGKEVSTLFELGVCVLQRGRRLEEAEVMLRSVLDIEKERLGSDDESVARVAFHLGVCLRRAGRREEAEELLSGCVETLKDKLGAEHEEVASAEEMLDSCAATE